MLDGVGPADVEEEAARVPAVTSTGRRLLNHRDRDSGVMCSDSSRCTGGAVPENQYIDVLRQAHSGGPVMIRSGSLPSQPLAAARTIA